ncbi:MAG: hypothetical protein JNL90_05095 [Planctomycetes bacterium]|nr:hypothetical protein [Planctomycetota bacterium]
MADVRAAHVAYQVYSSNPAAIAPSELAAILARHPVATGNLDLASFHGADAARFARESLPAAGDFTPPLDFEAYARLRQAKSIWSVDASEVEPEDLGYLRCALLVAGEIAATTGGMVVDALSYAVMGASDIVRELDRAFDPQRHVMIHVERSARPWFVHTHGMEKFGHADFELHGVPRASIEVARRLLRHLVAAVVAGGQFNEGEQTQLCGFHFAFGRSECEDASHFSQGSLCLRSFRLVAGLATPEMEGMLIA